MSGYGDARADLLIWNSGDETVNNTTEVEAFGLTTAGVVDEAARQQLFIKFEAAGDDFPAVANSFARIDDVNLSVTSVPEPSTGLLAVVGLALGTGYRRRK